MAFNAHLIGFGLDAILQIVSATRKSGAVTIVSEGWGARLFFSNGRVIYASSDSRERLGHRLIQRGHINEAQLRTALEIQALPGEDRPLASLLTEQGLISHDVVEVEVTNHIIDVVRDMLAWPDGSLIFEPVAPGASSIVLTKGLSVENLLLRAAARDENDTPDTDVEFTKLVGYSSE